MPSKLALIIYLGFVVWLFRRDFREKPNVTGALWLPFFWVAISGSRFVSQWLGMFGINLGGTSVEEGSPIDAVFFFGVIGGGLYVLYQRRVSLAEVMRNNQWVSIYLLYCLVAVVWSDFPLVAIKRWIKLFGQPVMVLIVLTEPDPLEALTRLMKRCAYVWVPISILFIKYFPELGRSYSNWTGEASSAPRNTERFRNDIVQVAKLGDMVRDENVDNVLSFPLRLVEKPVEDIGCRKALGNNDGF